MIDAHLSALAAVALAARDAMTPALEAASAAPRVPVTRRVTMPRARAASRAFTTFGLVPEVERPRATSPGRPSAST